jgi:hypothetical protein
MRAGDSAGSPVVRSKRTAPVVPVSPCATNMVTAPVGPIRVHPAAIGRGRKIGRRRAQSGDHPSKGLASSGVAVRQ